MIRSMAEQTWGRANRLPLTDRERASAVAGNRRSVVLQFVVAIIGGLAAALAIVDPVVYRAELNLRIRPPIESGAGAITLDGAASDAAAELSGETLAARVEADLRRASAGMPQTASAHLRRVCLDVVDGLLGIGRAKTDIRQGVLRVRVRVVAGAGRLELVRESLDPVWAPLVLNTLAGEYLRMRAESMAAQEAGLAAALQRVEGQMNENAAAYQSLLDRRHMPDRDLLNAAAAITYSQLLATQYAGSAVPGSRVPGATSAATARNGLAPVEETLSRLRAQRAELSGRYLAGTPPLREVDAAIGSVEAELHRSTVSSTGARFERHRGAGPAGFVRRWTAAQQLDPELGALVRERDYLRNDTALLADSLSRLRVARLAGSGGSADAEVVQPARVPHSGQSVRIPLMGAALVLILGSVSYPYRYGRRGASRPGMSTERELHGLSDCVELPVRWPAA